MWKRIIASYSFDITQRRGKYREPRSVEKHIERININEMRFIEKHSERINIRNPE